MSTLLKVRGNLPGYPQQGRWTLVSGEARDGLTVQFAASLVVVVNHNFGRQPSSVHVRTLGGVEVDCQVLHISANQLQLYFDLPTPGVVELA